MNKLNFKLFMSFFRISAFTFGGGFVIIALMKTTFVKEYKWIEEEEMMNFVAIAQSTPGAVPVNAALLVGNKVNGWKGALFALLGTIIPPLLIITTISFTYDYFVSSLLIQTFLKGMQIGVSILILDLFINNVKPYIKHKQIFPFVLFSTAFFALQYLKLHIVIVILFAGTCGSLYALYTIRKDERLCN